MRCAQLIHAAGESAASSKYSGDFPPGTYAIALSARDEAHLLEISRLLFENKTRYKMIRETDLPYSGQAMAIGIHPCERDKIRKLLSQLPLIK